MIELEATLRADPDGVNPLTLAAEDGWEVTSRHWIKMPHRFMLLASLREADGGPVQARRVSQLLSTLKEGLSHPLTPARAA